MKMCGLQSNSRLNIGSNHVWEYVNEIIMPAILTGTLGMGRITIARKLNRYLIKINDLTRSHDFILCGDE